MRTQVYTQSSVNHYHCLSTDTKPTGCPNGSTLVEIDTGDEYLYDEENAVWYKKNASGGDNG